MITNKKNKKILLTGFLAIAWIWTQYLQKGLVTTAGLESTDRHFFYPYIGFVLILGSLSLKNIKIWRTLLTILILINIFQTNYYFGQFEQINNQRENFYRQLRSYFANKPEKLILFIDAPKAMQQQLSDFIRVGMHPSEASIGTELGIKKENINIIVASNDLEKFIEVNSLQKDYYSFYYNGTKLINTTKDSQEELTSKDNNKDKFLFKNTLLQK